MAHKIVENYQKAVINNVRWVNALLWAGFSLSLIIILLKASKNEQFSWSGASLKVADGWLVFVLLTIAHIYATFLVVLSAYTLWKKTTYKDYHQTFQEVRSTGGIFVQNMLPRTKNRVYIFFNQRIFLFRIIVPIMSKHDPTTWLSFGALFALMISIIPFDFTERMRFIYMVFIAWTLASINWFSGMQWVAALSDLAQEKNESSYFIHLQNEIHEEA